jgi:hypothetical protein
MCKRQIWTKKFLGKLTLATMTYLKTLIPNNINVFQKQEWLDLQYHYPCTSEQFIQFWCSWVIHYCYQHCIWGTFHKDVTSITHDSIVQTCFSLAQWNKSLKSNNGFGNIFISIVYEYTNVKVWQSYQTLLSLCIYGDTL